jgi:hypothetical protein
MRKLYIFLIICFFLTAGFGCVRYYYYPLAPSDYYYDRQFDYHKYYDYSSPYADYPYRFYFYYDYAYPSYRPHVPYRP